MLYNSFKENKTILNKHVNACQVSQCSMHRATNALHNISTVLGPKSHQINIPKRYTPHQGYKVFKTERKIICNNVYEGDVVTSKGQELPLNENTHLIVRDNETRKDVGILTSAKNVAQGNINIASENYKGESKAQQFRAYEQPRYSADTTNMKKVSEATTYLNKYTKKMDSAITTSGNYKKPAILRLDKKSLQLYHENGLPIFDNNGKEIDYDN